MEKSVIKTGATVDEAIEAALSELGCTKEQATIEVVDEGTEGGFLGLGRKDAQVKVTVNEADTASAKETGSDDAYYGDGMFLVMQFRDAGKPVMVQDIYVE